MEITCSVSNCGGKPAFQCKCKVPAVFICDQHFSTHIKIKNLTHQYEFLSVNSLQQSPPTPPTIPQPQPIRGNLKNADIKKLLDSLPAATKQTLYKASNIAPGAADLLANLPCNKGPRKEHIEKITYSSKEFYEGEMENDKESGTGVFQGECIYEGDWKNGLPHGKGELKQGSARLFGNWYMGTITGQGELVLSNGDKYIGELRDNKFQGDGKYTFSNGQEIEGYFRDHFFISNDISTCIPNEYLKSIDIMKTDTSLKNPQRFQVLCKIFQEPLTKIEEKDSHQSTIKFFKNNSLILVSIKIETGEKTEETLNSESKCGFFAGICEIHGMLFHCGGLMGEKSTGNAFLLNPERKEINWLAAGNRRSSPCAINTENTVYVFGGSDNFLHFLPSAEKYSFATHAWTAIPPMPQASDSISGVLIGNYIVLSGYLHTKIYVFNIVNETYSEVLEVPDFKDKVFFLGGGKGYMLCAKKMFESRPGSPFEWKAIRDIVYNSGWPVGNPLRKENIFYWYNSDKELWKFDLDTKGVFLIKKFK